MKKIIPAALVLLLAALLSLSACGGAPAAQSGFAPPSSAPAPAQSGPDAAGDSSTPGGASPAPSAPESDGAGDWRGAYLAELNALSRQYGRYVQEEDSGAVTGVKYGQLLDFDGDGTRELVLLVDNTVRLYTCRAGTAVLLHEQEVGGRYGQTDVSYTFQINARSDSPCLAISHSQQEWTEEAITLVEVAGGEAVTTELFAQADRRSDLPTRDVLSAFQIDGRSVTREEYEARRAAALEGAVDIDRNFGAFPATRAQLELLSTALEQGRDDDYLLPDSDAALLTAEDLSGLSPSRLRLARNEIYARHGRTFQAADLQDYFNAQDWYVGIYSPEEFDPLADTLLNRYEAANLALIRAQEEAGSGNSPAAQAGLTGETARGIAAEHRAFDGSGEPAAPEAGRPTALSSGGLQPTDGTDCQIFRSARPADGSPWSTLDRACADAATGP